MKGKNGGKGRGTEAGGGKRRGKGGTCVFMSEFFSCFFEVVKAWLATRSIDKPRWPAIASGYFFVEFCCVITTVIWSGDGTAVVSVHHPLTASTLYGVRYDARGPKGDKPVLTQ